MPRALVIDNEAISFEQQRISNFNYYPTSTTGVVIERNWYAFSYSEEHEQSEWVAYILDVSNTKGKDLKRPYFNQDPLVSSQSADWRNYKNSGYDRGHLVPAGDMKFSEEAYNDTFFTSNISPQLKEFNSGVWNRLENKFRYWASKYSSLYVITGGVLKGDLKGSIGSEKVSVPSYFYKIGMAYDEDEGYKMIGFLLPHEASDEALYKFVVSVDSIEKLTGIDFFKELQDDLEEDLEKNDSYKKWAF